MGWGGIIIHSLQRDDMQRIAIIGLGLLGGSICKRVRKVFPAAVIDAYGRSPLRLEAALKDGVIDSASGLEQISLAGVDLAVVCTPVISSIDIILAMLGRDDCVPTTRIIDVGSVKSAIVKAVESSPRAGQFIPCHPMAGSEKMGYEHSRDDLFEGATVVITPHAGNAEEDIAYIGRFWEAMGASIVSMDPEAHDAIAARTSHLPHLTACALVTVLDEFRRAKSTREIGALIGRGFLDTTRLAAGSTEMWRDIAALNSDQIFLALDRLSDEIQWLKQAVKDAPREPERVAEYLAGAKRIREELD